MASVADFLGLQADLSIKVTQPFRRGFASGTGFRTYSSNRRVYVTDRSDFNPAFSRSNRSPYRHRKGFQRAHYGGNSAADQNRFPNSGRRLAVLSERRSELTTKLKRAPRTKAYTTSHQSREKGTFFEPHGAHLNPWQPGFEPRLN